MKFKFKTLSIIILSLSFIACGSSRSHSSDNRKFLHEQALKAIAERMFIIEGEQFTFPDDAQVKYSTGNFISLQNSKATIQFTKDLFPEHPFENLKIVDPDAGLTRVEEKRNGDIVYNLDMQGDKYWQIIRINITLLKNSYDCFVKIFNERMGNLTVSFKGRLSYYP